MKFFLQKRTDISAVNNIRAVLISVALSLVVFSFVLLASGADPLSAYMDIVSGIRFGAGLIQYRDQDDSFPSLRSGVSGSPKGRLMEYRRGGTASYGRGSVGLGGL